MTRHDLTKSKLTLFEQCPKRLWLQVNRPYLVELDEKTKAAFATGHRVGYLSCSLVKDGFMVTMEGGVRKALEETTRLVAAADRPIFEGTFQHDGVLVRVDIMRPDGKGGWHVSEVKSTASRKEYQIADLATQIWVLQGSGINVSTSSIRHINTGFVYVREGDYFGLLSDRISDAEIAPIMEGRPSVVGAARAVLKGEEPQIKPGRQCDVPFSCDFKHYCYRDLKKPDFPISLLPRTGARLAEAYARNGISDLAQVGGGELKNPLHERIRVATVTRIPFHDHVKAQEMTEAWGFPRTFLDFETVSQAIPRWLRTKPYQQIPFQFSTHIEQLSGALTHTDYLDISGADPRRGFAEALIEAIPDEGAIITYNARFERSRIRELAANFLDLSAQLKGIAKRVVDLEPVARTCWYHRDQKGSWSIKSVIPTLPAGPTYQNLEVQDGLAAQNAFLEALSLDHTDPRHGEIERNLRAYCAMDTEAMVALLNFLIEPPIDGFATP